MAREVQLCVLRKNETCGPRPLLINQNKKDHQVENPVM